MTVLVPDKDEERLHGMVVWIEKEALIVKEVWTEKEAWAESFVL